MEKQIFISIDGNGIGKRIESYILAERLDELQAFSKSISATVQSLANWIEQANGRVIMAGGDNILATLPQALLARFCTYVKQAETQELNFSIGYGSTALDAYLALKYAKANGIPCVSHSSNSNQPFVRN